jgi:hypothetical protein
MVPYEAKWEKGFAKLSEYKMAEGHCNVPTRYKTAEGYKLGGWWGTQRTELKKGQLSEERAKRLNGLCAG